MSFLAFYLLKIRKFCKVSRNIYLLRSDTTRSVQALDQSAAGDKFVNKQSLSQVLAERNAIILFSPIIFIFWATF